MAAVFMALVLMMPSFAFAESSSAQTADGSVEEPAVDIAPSDDSTDVVERDQQTVNGVTVSADGESALVDGAAYGIADFHRSQAGSNKAVDGTYYGYNYYIGTEPENLAVVSAGDYAVCYVPKAVQEKYGFLYDDHNAQDLLKRYFIALDDQNAAGSSRLSQVPKWYFTEDRTFTVLGVRYGFDLEITEGRYYTALIGEDGQDVTSQSHPSFMKPDFADFARAVDPDQVNIVREATGLQWFVQFITTMDYSPLWVTLRTTGTAIVFIFVLGLAAAYFTLRIPTRAKDIFDSIFTIPMVLPPTVCGFLLLLAFGRSTPLGEWFINVGFPLVFSWQATVIAAVVVAFPLMYRSARGAFENLDENMLDAARTLGWSDIRIFFRIMLPLSWSSIAAATVLAFARALGEFGATLFMAGNYAGITRTIPIAIYFEWMNGNTDVAIFWTLVIVVFSFVVILFINLWSRRTTKYRAKNRED